MASNIKVSWNADDGNLMLGQIEDFLPGLKDLKSLVASNIKVSRKADDGSLMLS